MATPHPDVTAALASLRTRWGAAAPRRLGEAGDVVGSLATAPFPEAPFPEASPAHSLPRPDDGRIVPTGFAALDAILGPGGLPHDAGVAVRGDGTSGRTTVALRLAAEAQAAGSIVAYLDLARSLDPVEAVARGVRLEWLVVLVPESIDDGLAMAGALVQGRTIDLLLVDLPDARPGHALPEAAARGGRPGVGGRPGAGGRRAPSVAERIGRLAAMARRAGTMLVILEPPGLPSGLRQALDWSTGLRLELVRRSWIRLGRDVVGQRTEVVVARNRFGPPGRRAELRILYADGGDRDACLRRDDLLHPPDRPWTMPDAPPPPLLASSPPPARPGAPRLRLVSDGAGRPRRAAVGRRARPRHEPGGARDGDPPGDLARERAPARA